METILILAHTEPGGALAKSVFEAVSAARSLVQALPGSSLLMGLVGEGAQGAANTLATCGAGEFLAVSGPQFSVSRYSTDAAAAEALSRAARATIILAPTTSRWARVLAGVAQRLGGKVDTHVSSMIVANGRLDVTRWYYRQRMEATITRQQRPWIIGIDPGSQEPWHAAPATAEVHQLQVNAGPELQRTSVTGFRETAGVEKTIRSEAELLFVAGAGWTKKQADGQPKVKEAEKLISDCLHLAKASLGSTKSLVDLGGEGQAVLSFLTHLNQVGQTGSTPRHPKGLATCCHGEEPHTVGWRFINERRAINLDPNCGWARGKADVLYVADAFAVVSRLNDILRQGS